MPSASGRKIVFLMPANLKVGRGVERALLNYVKYFKAKGWFVSIVQSDFIPYNSFSEKYIEFYVSESPICTVKSPYTKFERNRLFNSILGRLFFLLLSKSYGVFNWIKNTEFRDMVKESNVIYFFDNNYQSSLLSRSSIKNKIVVATNHTFFGSLTTNEEMDWLTKIEYKLIGYNLLFRKVNALRFTISSNKLSHILGNRRLIEVPSGVDTDVFFPSTDGSSPNLNFLFVASLERPKGILTVLEAWKKWQSTPKAKLHIAGTGSLSDIVCSAAEMDPSIDYHEELSQEKLATLYRTCDIFIYPTKGDTFGLVVLEALASGNYVICSSYLKGIFDKFEERKYLEYVEPTVSSLVMSLNSLNTHIENIKSRTRKKHQFEFVKDHFAWSSISESLSNSLLQLVETK